MDLPWPQIVLSSIVGSFCLVQFAPQLTLFGSYFGTFSLLIFTLTLVGLAWKVVLWPKLFSPIRHLPSPSGGSFFNGQWSRIINDPSGAPHQDWIQNIPNDGLIYYNGLLNGERLLLASPQALSEVLVTKNYEFIKPGLLRNGLGRLLGNGVLLAEGDEHKLQRRHLMPAFAYRHIKDLYPVFWDKSRKWIKALMREAQEHGKEAVDDIKDAAVIEIGGWGSRVALDIVGVAGMGQDFDAIDNPKTELNATYRKVFQPSRQQQIMGMLGFFLPQWFLRSIPIAHNSDIVEASKTIKKVCRQLIRQKQEKLDHQEKLDEVDIISVALKSGGFSEEGLVNQMMTFLAAGHETTATSITWATYLLCLHPEIQTRLREEVRSHLPSIGDDLSSITSEQLDKVHYLHAVCNEVLRLYSPVPLTMRETSKPTTILNHYVPKGTQIVFGLSAVNTSTALWGPDALEFKPERWLGPGRANNGGATSNFAFMTFLHGPRSCIGQSFARAEFACLMAAMVGKFEWELEDPEWKPEIKGGITARPKGGMLVRMKPVAGW